ncbi:FKBP-type peptidyl-prolyl cis-trans isomerase [Amycolatopsis suaedae]|uniref:Peptidyl-prolyl cis-trans isomerase n=1 Tax=Amycolatopsis suaedae TaxID=2510978 RepID=A0A4Q7JG42_9PSEU|nr:FKBP-type peptidyl-prolyl cis-trans isomerase [Amycolatopsis suaedae]RZQ65694.1 FKBP-type peptidyl-prolyl cis-trans isomerase [Amycolatopsis suaedae]
MRKPGMIMVAVAAAALTLAACTPSEEDSPLPPGAQPSTAHTPPPPAGAAPPPVPPPAPRPEGPECTVDQIEVKGDKGEKPEITLPQGCAPPTKVLTKDLEPGTGRPAANGMPLQMNYLLMTWSDKNIVDNSYDRGQPFELTLGEGRVIPGWEEGLQGIYQGGRRVLVIPPDKGYGPQGKAPVKPNETLVFVVDAVKVG